MCKPTTCIRLPLLLLAALLVLLSLNTGKFMTDDRPAAGQAAVPGALASHEIPPDGTLMIERTYRVSAGDRLEIRVAHADVTVESGATDEAQIEVFLQARDMERARRYFDDLRFEVEQQGNTVSVTTNQRPGLNWSFNRNGGARISVRVVVPERFEADLRLSHGDLELGSLAGRADIRASHGDVDVTSLRGPAISFELSHGDLQAERIEGETVTLRSSHGDMDLRTVLAASLDAGASHGDIRIDALEGRAELTDSHGDIAVRFIKSNGFRIRNSHGDVDVQLPAGNPGDVQLSGASVRVASEFGFEGTLRKDRAEGRINGGGPQMEVHTSHGSVTLRAD